MAAPSVEAALRQSQRMVNGEPSNLRDAILADYGVDIDARPTQYVSRSEYGYGPGQLPAVQASGAHYSAPGAREGYEAYNLPPVMYQRNPFATAAYRTFVDPYGQMSVQPLVGFPSAYPHVLSGVPTNPFNIFGMLSQMPMPFMPPWMMGGMGGMPSRAPQGRGDGGSRNRGTGTPPATPPDPNQPATPPPPNAQWVHYGDARAKADAMPVSPENLAWMNSLNVAPPVATGPTNMEAPENFNWRWDRQTAPRSFGEMVAPLFENRAVTAQQNMPIAESVAPPVEPTMPSILPQTEVPLSAPPDLHPYDQGPIITPPTVANGYRIPLPIRDVY